MRAIFWKELRENAKWAALGLVVISLGLAYAWARTTDPQEYYSSFQGILAPAVLMVTTLGSAIVGGALGLLQIVPEQARDRWAFLVHRPTSLGAIFRGKALAGVLLYLAATLPPFLVLAWWASRPGAYAGPFDWAMTYAGLSDIFCGLIFYFAGLLTAVRPGKWWGSRALAIPAAISFLLESMKGEHFPSTMLWSLAALALFAVAAGTSFVANGEYTALSWLGRVTLFLVLFFGVLQLISWANGLREFAMRQNYSYDGTQYAVLKDGTPVKQKYSGGSIKKLVTLDDKEVPLTPEKLASLYNELLPEAQLSLEDRSWLPPFRSVGRYAQQLSNFNDSLWYYSMRSKVYETYERTSMRRTGALTENGFIPGDKAPPIPGFPGRLASTYNSYGQSIAPIFGHTVFLVDLVNHTVSRLYTAEGPGAPVAAMALRGDNQGNNAKYVPVLTREQIAVFDLQGKKVLSLPLSHDPKIWRNFQFFITPDASRAVLFVQPGSDEEYLSEGKLPTIVETYDATGALVAQRELPGRTRGVSRFSYMTLYYAAFSTLYSEYYYKVYGLLHPPKDKARAAAFAALEKKQDGANLLASTIGTYATALLCAGLAGLRLRGQQTSRLTRAVWLLTTFLTGIAGLLAFIATRPKVTSVPCPSCAAPRLITGDACEHCQAAWENQRRDGTEVFASRDLSTAQ